MPYAIGIDVGGTRIKAVAISDQALVLDKVMRRTGDGGEAWRQGVRQLVREMQDKRGGPARWLGVGAPGIAAADGSCITWMAGRLEWLVGLDWTDLLERDKPAPVINDAQAALMGEVWPGSQGAAQACDNVAMLTLGTGVGGAVICDGRLLRGALGRAGHLGHISLDPDAPGDICNTPGSLENAIGNCTIAQRSAGQFASTFELLEAYKAGDAAAKAVWETSIKRLAAGIVSVINAFDPSLVLLAGGVAQAGDALMKPLRAYLDQFEWRPQGQRVAIELASGGEFTGAIGAAYNAMTCDPV